MSKKNPMPATDSARDLHNLVHDDVTADFETDPKFIESNPTAEASSENLAALRDTDDEEDSDDELEDEDEDEDLDDDELEDEDEDLDDEEDEEAEYDDEDEDDEESDDEDDEDEVGSSDPSRLILKRAA
jgi:segregation and condensation protein B